MSKEEEEQNDFSKEEKKQEALRLIGDMNAIIARQVLLEREKRQLMDRLKGFVKKHNSIPRELVGAQEKMDLNRKKNDK